MTISDGKIITSEKVVSGLDPSHTCLRLIGAPDLSPTFTTQLNNIKYKIIGGIKTSMGYLGSKKIINLRKKPKFVKITKAGFYESMVHNIDEIKKENKF